MCVPAVHDSSVSKTVVKSDGRNVDSFIPEEALLGESLEPRLSQFLDSLSLPKQSADELACTLSKMVRINELTE